ncbi:hypothetical protein RFH42_13545 [Acinetobacter rudis]|uniref:hypothetical protein n=1 Tax=Acinetobacter rudis TaxID=632955 RepID=UPI00280F0DCF|nr:hypothetical protein [Acinetobacter rudis]MDQ8953973.1 hypothetical protein [Acinetobacter rudis]
MLSQLPRDYLYRIKASCMDGNKSEHFHGKCPSCNKTIAFYEAHTASPQLPIGVTLPSLDEKGVMVGVCENCTNHFKLEIINPDFSGFNSGAEKDGFYLHGDKDIKQEKDYKEFPSMTDYIKKDTILNKKNPHYDFDDYPLYVCNDCEQNLETISFHHLQNKWQSIKGPYWNYINWSLGNARGASPKNIVINFPFYCTCGKKHIANFISEYQENNNFEEHLFSLINIAGSRELTEVIFGVHTKTAIMTWLYKLIARWNFLYDRVYIISPFVGYTFLKNTPMVNTWLNMLGRLDPQKTSFLLRSGQVTAFKNAFTNINDISYEEMEEFNLGSELIKQIKNKQNFHAKIYCGVSLDRCEILNGSSNIIEGPSYEVINFDVIHDYATTFNKFLKPLNIDDISNELKNSTSKEYSLFFDEEQNFKPFVFYKKDYIKYGADNITPKSSY